MVEFATKPAKGMENGTRMTLRNESAEYAPDHEWGPRIKLGASIVFPEEYEGQTVKYDIELYQPRTKQVREKRGEGFDDESIAKVLRKKGYTFDSIDDPEPIRLPAPGTAPAKVLLACHGGDRKAIEACKTLEEAAQSLVGKTWVAESRLGNEDFVRVDGKGFIGPASPERPNLSTIATAKVRHAAEDERPPDDEANAPIEEDEDFEDISFD